VAITFSHLSNIFTVARPAWGYPLSRQEFDDAVTVIKKLGLIRKGNERNRRPSLEELDRLMEHFGRVRDHRPSSIPMQKIVGFALFSTRRQEEITLLKWDDLDSDRILVRDMKHPGDKKGNNAYCELPPEAVAIINSMPRDGEQIFPYSTDAISTAFTRACRILGIEDLRFHDLRHEGISRLFEMGRTIPQVAAVSGHRSWTSLKRYTHIRQSKDKYENWKWAKLGRDGALVSVCVAAVAISQGEFGIKPDRPVTIGDGPVVIAFVKVRITKIVVGHARLRIELDRLIVVSDGPVEIVFITVRLATVQVSVSQFGIEPDRFVTKTHCRCCCTNRSLAAFARPHEKHATPTSPTSPRPQVRPSRFASGLRLSVFKRLIIAAP
jgi:hypothetical protein